MNRIRRRLLIHTSLIGIVLTASVAILDYNYRLFRSLEDWFYDFRAANFQRYTPPASDKIAHVVIDDATLEAVGRWPWPRVELSKIIAGIHEAQAKVIALDIEFSEPSTHKYQDADGQRIDDDRRFADVVSKSGNVLVPASMSYQPAPPKIQQALIQYMLADLELTEEQCQARLLADSAGLLKAGEAFPRDQYLAARREAMMRRLDALLARRPGSRFDDARAALLPHMMEEGTGWVSVRLLKREFERARARQPLHRFFMALPEGLPPPAEFNAIEAPVAVIGEAARYSGYVNYLQRDERGVVRSVPLAARVGDKLFPQIDLAVACAMCDVDPGQVVFESEQIIIPRAADKGGPIRIPLRERYSPTYGRRIGLVMDVPVRGQSAWETIYDSPGRSGRDFFVPAVYIYELSNWKAQISRNNRNIDAALQNLLAAPAAGKPLRGALDPAKASEIDQPLGLEDEDFETRRPWIADAQALFEKRGVWLAMVRGPSCYAECKEAHRALSTLAEQNARFTLLMNERRADLKRRLGGKAVYVGWAATSLTDIVRTPIQSNCPGSVVHGVVVNGILTGDFWRRAPKSVTLMITIVIGLLVTLANGFLRPPAAILVAVLLGGGYVLLNGFVLFDYGNWIVGMAGPMVTLVVVWAAGAVVGYWIEAKERAAIKRKFSSYVDQKLVEYVIEHPEASLKGEVREMSVIFTDLQGFTTLSEKLREQTVSILSRYLGKMVPIIRKNDGFVNKFLGDGIMCFFNAPMENKQHARDAVLTCLQMQAELAHFADELVAQGLPRLAMRCGVSSGQMVVGDSGPADACDYTVLGDAVNLASRLEGANKVTGTRILVSERTAELAGRGYLMRPVGRLQVVGKTLGVMTFEPLAAIEEATAEQKAQAEICGKLVDAFVARDFARCMELIARMDDQFGVSKLANLYRKVCQSYLQQPPDAGFTGCLVLTEK